MGSVQQGIERLKLRRRSAISFSWGVDGTAGAAATGGGGSG